MRTAPSSALEDPALRVPDVPAADAGVAWLRAHVVRFSEGPSHTRRREVVAAVIADLTPRVQPGGDPTERLLLAFGLPAAHVPDVALVADAYQPHAPQSPEADAAADRLVAALGPRDERTAARVGVLVQAHAATRTLVDRLRTGDPRPPVPSTRRIAPDGEVVEVDLTDAPFGRGHHACPGRTLAIRLATAALP
ncbi:hypothetical protein [Cellulomonas sp. KH9]|uniref:hypothetical protein n=1 Tax=Cellulomonas sp. KH9 TaxID=1855324 RepID=UPI0008EF944D|nr:hypothetical protein [Cellulomonas sp. KH9]SFK42089.1 hypothetical protein SAMN05216467_3207 [Cellulomonas sp. KH9]